MNHLVSVRRAPHPTFSLGEREYHRQCPELSELAATDTNSCTARQLGMRLRSPERGTMFSRNGEDLDG